MKCHYDVLGVSREAEESEIKSAYKKLALRWHPDKNLDSPAEAKEQFQLVQQAYEVLSDRQERAWYDNHREQILRGSNKDYKDDCLDVFPYFTTACFSGYCDTDGGFYAVYSKVFETIAKEEMEYMEKEEFCEIPRFGNSQSDYETTVAAFYNFWLGYSTKRSYVWVDPYQVTADMRERRLLKLMEKENKKVRSKAKKERNEEVRNLVAFVRKRDKRVQAYSKVLEARAAENKMKQEEMAKQRRLARLKEIEETQIGEWMKLDNVQSELREIERSMAKEFGEELSEISDDDDDDELYSDDLFCIACSKLFKTSRAFENHEASKKHKEKMRFLKETMLKEESEMMKEDTSENETEEIGSESEEIVTDDEEVLSEEEVEESKRKKNKRRNKKVLPVNHVEGKDESAVRLDVGADDNADDKDFSVSKVKKKGKRQKKDQQAKTQQQQKEKQVIEEEEEEALPRGHKKKKKQKRMNDATTKRAAAVASMVHEEGETTGGDDQQDKGHSCASCKAHFDSKNKLFEHLKRTGHSVHIQKEQSGGVLGKKSKKDKLHNIK